MNAVESVAERTDAVFRQPGSLSASEYYSFTPDC